MVNGSWDERMIHQNERCWMIVQFMLTLWTLLPCGIPVFWLTHWGRVTHICVGKLTIIGSDNGLSPGRRQAIIWTNAGIMLIEPLGTNFSEILIGIQIFSFKKMCLKMSSAKWRPFCLGLNVLNWVNIMSDDVLAPEVTRPSSEFLLTVWC